MRTTRAALGSAVFFVLAPGTVAGLIPWLITGWDSLTDNLPIRAVGVLVIAAGLVPLVSAFIEFTRAGGTPAPPAPTEHLVVSGFNRYLRNPMYAGVVAIIAGQALLFGSVPLLVYAVIAWAVMATFVRWYEEPLLAEQYGAEYAAYKKSVRGWIPRTKRYT